MLEGVAATDIGLGTLVGIFFLLMFFGRIKPKSDVDRADAAAEKWRQAYETEREARATADAQTAELLELADTTQSILIALRDAVMQSRRTGGADVVSSSQD